MFTKRGMISSPLCIREDVFVKKNLALIIWCLTACYSLGLIANSTAQEAVRIDSIKAVIYTEGDTYIITESDLVRPSLDGSPVTLESKIFQCLAYEKAKQRKMLPEKEDIDKHLQTVQRENNLTIDQLKAIFSSAGYTYEEGREQFGIMSAINTLLDFEVRSSLMVPEKEVVAYYNQYPERRPAAYYLERTVVPFSADISKEELKEQLVNFSKNKQGFIVWSTPFWITLPELAQDKMFITTMKPGDVSAPVEVENGFELFRLKEIKPEDNVPLQERYQEIAAILRKPRYEKKISDYKKGLRDTASIVYY
jgi:parvulin-like peptidyl-prolyl isomerase